MSNLALTIPEVTQSITNYLEAKDIMAMRGTSKSLADTVSEVISQLDFRRSALTSVNNWRPFPSVKKLYLDHTPFVDLSELKRVFPSLVSLSLSHCKKLANRSWKYLNNATHLIELFLSNVVIDKPLDLSNHHRLKVLWIDNAIWKDDPTLPHSLHELNVTGWKTDAYTLAKHFPHLIRLGVDNTGTPISSLIDLAHERETAFIDPPTSESGRLQAVRNSVATLDESGQAFFLAMDKVLCELSPYADRISLLEEAVQYAKLSPSGRELVDNLAKLKKGETLRALIHHLGSGFEFQSRVRLRIPI